MSDTKELLLVRQAIFQVLDDKEWNFHDTDEAVANDNRVDFADAVLAWITTRRA